MHLHTFTILGLCLLILGCVASPALPTHADARLQVMATETAFAKTMADRDHKAFSTFIADDAVFFAGNDPLRGKQRVIAWWARYYAAPSAPFWWEPEEVEILDSGTLASRQQQEIVDERTGSIDLRQNVLEEVVASSRRSQLDGGADAGERAAEFMGSVCRELLVGQHSRLEPVECVVQGSSELLEFVSGLGHGDSPSEVVCCGLFQLFSHCLDRPQRPRGQPRRGQRGGGGRESDRAGCHDQARRDGFDP